MINNHIIKQIPICGVFFSCSVCSSNIIGDILDLLNSQRSRLHFLKAQFPETSHGVTLEFHRYFAR